jgi:hypothetical protein
MLRVPHTGEDAPFVHEREDPHCGSRYNLQESAPILTRLARTGMTLSEFDLL